MLIFEAAQSAALSAPFPPAVSASFRNASLHLSKTVAFHSHTFYLAKPGHFIR